MLDRMMNDTVHEYNYIVKITAVYKVLRGIIVK